MQNENHPWYKRLFRGIRGTLFFSFFALALSAILLGVFVSFIFAHIRESVDALTHKSLPAIALTLRLDDLSSVIVSRSSTLLNNATPELRHLERVFLEEKTQELRALVNRLSEFEVPLNMRVGLISFIDHLAQKIILIDRFIGEKILLSARVREKSERFTELHDEFLDKLESLIDEAVFRLIIGTEKDISEKVLSWEHQNEGAHKREIEPKSPNKEEIILFSDLKGEKNIFSEVVSESFTKDVYRLHALLRLQSEMNLLLGLVKEAIAVSELPFIPVLQEQFRAASDQVTRAFQEIGTEKELRALQVISAALQSIGLGEEDNLFALRLQEFELIKLGERAILESRSLSQNFLMQVEKIVRLTQDQGVARALHAEDVLFHSQILILFIAGLSLCGAFAVVFFYVNPRVVAPIEQITDVMVALSQGNTQVTIPHRKRRDELGAMAKSLDRFHAMTVKIQETNLREIEEGRQHLSDAIESISEAFSLYDNTDKLRIFNKKYASMVYPEIAEKLVPGISFEAVLRFALEAGCILDAQDQEEIWFEERLRRHRAPETTQLIRRPDNIWLMVSEHRTADGGTVAVYSDITEMKKRETELAEKSQALELLSQKLSKYLSPQIYQSIFKGERAAVLESRRKKLTVFFSDIVGFTELSDRLESEDLTYLLNKYLTEMTQIALSHGATIDKYIGDALMIFFGDPVSFGVKEDALHCVRMAIAMKKRLAELVACSGEEGLPEPLQCRIGIHTGYCTVGNFGSEDRLDYTIVGGAVNLAARLEKQAEQGGILISHDTYRLIKDKVLCEECGAIEIRGFAYPVRTYRVIDLYENLTPVSDQLHIAHGNFSLEINLSAMSAGEKEQARQSLYHILAQMTPEE